MNFTKLEIKIFTFTKIYVNILIEIDNELCEVHVYSCFFLIQLKVGVVSLNLTFTQVIVTCRRSAV